MKKTADPDQEPAAVFFREKPFGLPVTVPSNVS